MERIGRLLFYNKSSLSFFLFRSMKKSFVIWKVFLRKRRSFKYYVVYSIYEIEFSVISFRFAVKKKQIRKIIFIIKRGKSGEIF